jgi:uncharacterized membrane protein
MSGLTELLDLVARWVHVIAGIMWIGNSLLFNWLDRSLDKRASERRQGDALGTIWLLHSGGFYYVEKTLLAREQLPTPLHWFKWQAYTTWISGLGLLLVVYWLGGRAVMADPSAGESHATAVAIGVGGIAAGWLLYESMNRFVAPRAPALALGVWVAGLLAIMAELLRHLDGRAAFLHAGAMLGTLMAGNVVFTIVPSQRELVESVETGRTDRLAALSARAKRVSIHNNYFTFPVIALMVSNHFPALYGGSRNWVSLLVLIAGGAGVRLLLNLRFTWPAWRPALAAVLVATVGGLWASMRFAQSPTAPAATAASGPVSFDDARHVIDRRCAACHSATPTDVTFGAMPAGVAFDTPEQILARVDRIDQRAVVTRTMPPANKTGITDVERALLGRWIAQGARR